VQAALQQHHRWRDMLADLANQEVTVEDPSDPVIILGPHVLYYVGVPHEMLKQGAHNIRRLQANSGSPLDQLYSA
jgi:hypothetical protein